MVLLLACTDPELAPVADALEAWDEARAAQVAGDLGTALQKIREARALDPRSPALAGWEAELLRVQGRPEASLAVLDAALSVTPDHAELRQQRAWLRMAAGDATGAAADLAPLVRAGLVDAEDLADEPHYAPLGKEPA
ncbi:MAG: tetratricopeptide repeat protein, partial [Myxococcota bacterium]|nr:tetratricopeptide repeat protein [Myxococcota bacterium]